MITSADFYKQQLQEQVNLLIDACHIYDQGSFSQAKIISGIIRTLVKDPARKSQTISLLTSLDIKNGMKFYNTGYSAKDPSILLNLVGFVSTPVFLQAYNTYQRIYIPILEDSQLIDVKWIDFDDWWESDVVVNKTIDCEIHLSRRKIVLTMAEQDGGVHVDSFDKIDSVYRAIITHTANIFTHHEPSGSQTPIEYLQHALVRQIAHELLISIFAQFNIFKPYKPTNRFILKDAPNARIIPPFLIALNDGDLSTRTDTPINYDRGPGFVAPPGTKYIRLEIPDTPNENPNNR